RKRPTTTPVSLAFISVSLVQSLHQTEYPNPSLSRAPDCRRLAAVCVCYVHSRYFFLPCRTTRHIPPPTGPPVTRTDPRYILNQIWKISVRLSQIYCISNTHPNAMNVC